LILNCIIQYPGQLGREVYCERVTGNKEYEKAVTASLNLCAMLGLLSVTHCELFIVTHVNEPATPPRVVVELKLTW